MSELIIYLLENVHIKHDHSLFILDMLQPSVRKYLFSQTAVSP